MPFDTDQSGTAGIPHNSSQPGGLIDLITRFATHPTAEGLAYIEANRDSIPPRRVRRSQFNGGVRFAGENSRFVQEGESLTNEYALLIELDYSQAVVKSYFSQPKPLALDYRTASGKRTVHQYHPDILVELVDGRALLVEAKPYEIAKKHSDAGHPRFTPGPGEPAFLDLPAQAACAPLGIPHLIVTSHDINTILVGNYLFIGKGYKKSWSPGETTRIFIAHVNAVGGCTYQDVTQNADGWSADDVIGAIANGLVYVDLKTQRLGGFAPVHIFPSEDFAKMTRQSAEKWPALPIVSTNPQKSEVDLSGHSPKALATAHARFSLIKLSIDNEKQEKALRPHQRKWLRRYRAAAIENGAGFIGLIPDYSKRGFSGPRLHCDIEQLLDQAVITAAGNCLLPPGVGAYGDLRLKCKALNRTPPSRQTFYKRLKEQKSKMASITAREGGKGAYQKLPAAPLTPSAISRTAQRAWQLGLLDHTPLPIRVISSMYGQPIEGTPWLTYLRDSAKDKILGMHLSLQHPSTVSVQGALWDCYRIHRRMPDALLLDGEKAHDSIAVEKLLGMLIIDKICRRYLCPRDGALIERGFSLLEVGLLAYLNGNYVSRQDPKDWPRNWTPSQFADRTLGSLWLAIRIFFFEHFNQTFRLAKLGNLTPDQAMATSLHLHGQRNFRVHNDIKQVQQLLLPLAKRGALVHLERQTGIRSMGQRYLPQQPIDPALYGKSFLVRWDPHDITYALVRLDSTWHEFRHQKYKQFENLDRDQLAAVSVEFAEIHRQHSKAAPDRAEQSAIMLRTIDGLPKDPLADFLQKTTNHIELPQPMDDSIWFKARSHMQSTSGTIREDIP